MSGKVISIHDAKVKTVLIWKEEMKRRARELIPTLSGGDQ
jgi:hypothetical protein